MPALWGIIDRLGMSLDEFEDLRASLWRVIEAACAS
jgi:hypothetical protein